METPEALHATAVHELARLARSLDLKLSGDDIVLLAWHSVSQYHKGYSAALERWKAALEGEVKRA